MNSQQPTKKGFIWAVILIIAVLVTAGCALSGAVAAKPTAAPSLPPPSTATPVAPTATSTETPTALPPTQENKSANLPGSTDELVAQYLSGVTMNNKVAMDDATWIMLGAVAQDGGIMLVGGTDITLANTLQEVIAGNQGYLMTFKLVGPTAYHIGLTDAGADQFSYEISASETSVETFIYRSDKADSSFGQFTGDLTIKPDTLYKLLVAYEKDGNFLMLIWEDQNPANVLVTHFMGEKDWWKDLNFEISTRCDKGKLFIQDVTLLNFSKIK